MTGDKHTIHINVQVSCEKCYEHKDNPRIDPILPNRCYMVLQNDVEHHEAVYQCPVCKHEVLVEFGIRN